MKTAIKTGCAISLIAVFAMAPMRAYALFEDDEARIEILKMRKKLEEIDQRIDSRLAPVNTRIETKADKRIVMDMAGEIERLRSEVANLRGQVEVMTNELANSQSRLKDFYIDLDSRLQKLEQDQASGDARNAEAEKKNEIQLAFNAALTLFKEQKYADAELAYNRFLQTYSDSDLASEAHYWLGNAYYAQRNCVKAIQIYQNFTTRFSSSKLAPLALLNTANCQLEQNAKDSALESLEALIQHYPDSEAAGRGKAQLKDLNSVTEEKLTAVRGTE